MDSAYNNLFRPRELRKIKLIPRVGLLLAITTTAVFAQPKSKMEVVGIIGCLAETDGEWHLTKASKPVPASTIDNELAKTSLGNNDYHLIGTLQEFNPSKHKGHKVRVKGLLTENTTNNRSNLNLTSLKHLTPDCP